MIEWLSLSWGGGTCLAGRRVVDIMYIVYILRSISKPFQYVGMTTNIERHLSEHNSGYSTTTKKYLPLKLIYTEECPDSRTARIREKYLKSGAGREHIKSLNL